MTNPIDKLRELLIRHDPYYTRSDDSSVWRKGEAEAEQIASLQITLAALGCADEVDDLIAEIRNSRITY